MQTFTCVNIEKTLDIESNDTADQSFKSFSTFCYLYTFWLTAGITACNTDSNKRAYPIHLLMMISILLMDNVSSSTLPCTNVYKTHSSVRLNSYFCVLVKCYKLNYLYQVEILS